MSPWAVSPCASRRVPTAPAPSDHPPEDQAAHRRPRPAEPLPEVRPRARARGPARQPGRGPTGGGRGCPARGQAEDRLGGDPGGARAGRTPPSVIPWWHSRGPLAGDGAEQRRGRPARGGSTAIALPLMLDGRGAVIQSFAWPPVSPMDGDQAGHPACGSAAGARGPGSGSHGGDPPRTPWPEHGCDPSPTAGPSLPPCGSRCQGVRIGGWRRAAMSVGVSPRGGDDLSCPGKGWWRVSMCHRRAPVVSSTGGGVLMGSPRPGSRSQTRGLRRADRVDGPPGRWHGSVRLRNMRATGWMLRRNADRGRRRSWQITDDQGLADFRVRHTRITPRFAG